MKVLTRKLAFLVAASAVAAGTAGAQVTFVGSTRACFYTGAVCNPASPATTASTGGLTFTPGSFTGTTNPMSGEVGIGGTGNNFGLLSYTGGAPFTAGTRIRLDVLFNTGTDNGSLPGGAATTPTFLTFLGTVTGGGTGANDGATIRWDMPMMAFNYTSAQGSGPATLTLSNPVAVNNGNPAQAISGVITAQVVPEPATVALVGAGLLGLMGAGAVRRRQQA